KNGRWLYPRCPNGPGVLGCRPASVLLEAISWLQEQRAHHDLSLHEMRSVGIVRGEVLVAVSALGRSGHKIAEPPRIQIGHPSALRNPRLYRTFRVRFPTVDRTWQ